MQRIFDAKKLSLIASGAIAIAVIIVLQSSVIDKSVVYDSSLRILPLPANAQEYPAANVPVKCFKDFDEVISKAKYKVMTPHLLPVGYSLQGADYTLDTNVANGAKLVSLYYWDKPLCGVSTQYTGGPVLNGAIALHVTNYPEITDTKAALQSVIDTSEPEYNVHFVTVNEHTGVGWEAGTGKSIFILEDGTVVQEGTFPYPSRVMFYIPGENSNILYHIEANMPLEDILKIARSIR